MCHLSIKAMKKLFLSTSIFFLVSCNNKSKDPQPLPDTKLFIQDLLMIQKSRADSIPARLIDYIENVYNKDKSRPAINNVSLYVPYENNSSSFVNVLILTNYVNERSRKYEFDNMILYNFIQQNLRIPARTIGGLREDVEGQNYRLVSKHDFVYLPVDSSWLIESKDSVSLFHNDYEVAKKIAVHGFDTDGEPEIQIMKNGSLYIVFNHIPPSNGADPGGELGEFSEFDKYLSKELNEQVEWIDREFFLIKNPRKETAQKIKELLENYWKRKNK